MIHCRGAEIKCVCTGVLDQAVILPDAPHGAVYYTAPNFRCLCPAVLCVLHDTNSVLWGFPSVVCVVLVNTYL